jgi:hypothetical protein
VSGNHPILKVVFLANGVPVGEDTASPYEMTWSGADDGPIELRADAHEQGGSIVSSSIVSITVVDTPDATDVLLVVGEAAIITTSEVRILERLDLLGFNVVTVDDNAIKASAAEGKALVLVSASVSPGKVGSAFTGVSVPVITWEGGLFGDLGMTGPVSGVDFGETDSTDKRQVIVVAAPSHPLAAGLSGVVIVSDPASRFMWGTPAPSAALVATLENEPTRYAVFGYESGAPMVSGSAPARRVGLFLHGITGSTLTAPGWAMFDASVLWATGG